MSIMKITKARGAKIFHLRQIRMYMREMLVEDPDGHIIRFGNGIE